MEAILQNTRLRSSRFWLSSGCAGAAGVPLLPPPVVITTAVSDSALVPASHQPIPGNHDHWAAEMLDYNEEARKLFASLDGSKPSRFNNLDPIYRSEAGGFIYVGGDLVIFLFSSLPNVISTS